MKKSDSMSTIIQQFKEQFPEICPETLANDRYATYSVLHHFGAYCAQHFGEKKATEILDTVNGMYQRDILYIRNAIENEFLDAMATQLDVSNLMGQLEAMPTRLWEAYIKVLIETHKNDSQ